MASGLDKQIEREIVTKVKKMTYIQEHRDRNLITDDCVTKLWKKALREEIGDINFEKTLLGGVFTYICIYSAISLFYSAILN